jgi:hypothetical protein
MSQAAMSRPDASLEDDLYAMEQGFWTAGADYYRAHLDARCLVAFVGMAGVMAKEDVAKSAGDGDRWKDLSIARKGYLQPTAGTAILTYEASAARADGEPYRALVTSAYASRGGEWKMVLHTQTPLDLAPFDPA